MSQDTAELKARIDIVEYIGQTVPLKKEGSNFRGLCPLHADRKTESLVVYPDTQRWQCFGCGKKGDAIQWLMELEHLDFKAACTRLEDRYGMKMRRDGPAEPKETVYDIVGADGSLVAQHVRLDLPGRGKKFIWRRNGKDSLGGLKVEDLPLYGMKGLREAAPGVPVIITEGEKAADALIRLGYVALGTVTGANVCPSVSAFEPLIGSERVQLWPDNDAPGYAHIEKVANALRKLEIDPYLVRWEAAPPKADAFDFCQVHGRDGVETLLTNAQPWPTRTGQFQIVSNQDAIEQCIKLLSGNTIGLRAENIRRERTGIHSRITISLDGGVIGWDVLNIERNEERQRLARSAVERLPDGVGSLCDLPTLKGYLDSFTASLWDNSVSQDMPRLVTPGENVGRIEFLAEPYVMTGGGTILFAPPGAGKSYICLLMAVSIDADISTLWPVTQAKVLFINLERSEESVTRRLTMVNKALGLPATRPLLILNRRGKALADIAEAVKRAIKKHEVRAVFLDSNSRFGSGDLNENQTANRTIDTLSSISPTWFALGHTPRADESHAYGSVHFDAGADLMVQLSSESKDSTLGIGLKITKSNDTPRGQMQTYALTFNENCLTDARTARPYEFGELLLQQKLTLTDKIKQVLREKTEATVTEIHKVVGGEYSSVSRLLTDSEDFTKTRKDGRNQYYGFKDKHLGESQQ